MLIGYVAVVAMLTTAAPVELKPGVSYQGPQTIRVASEGIAFGLGPGWVGQLPPQAEAMVIQHRERPGVMLASVRRATKAEATATMSAPIPIEPGLTMVPTGNVKARGNVLTADYSAGELRGFALARLHRDGRVVAVVGLAPAAAMKGLKAAIRALGKSVRFMKIKPAVAASPAGSLAEALAGRKLHRFFGDYGYREHQTMTLCRNGRFFYNMEAGGVTRGMGSGAASSNGQGRWSISGDQLQLRWDNGGTRTYRVQQQDGKLLLNGNKWLRESAGC